MELVVKLAPALAASMRFGGNSSDVEPLKELMRAHGVTLRPIHPTVTEGELAKMFQSTVAEAQQGHDLAARLRALDGVEGAFVKPSASLP